MKGITEIYETCGSDGYSDQPTGKYYSTKASAESAGKIQMGGWCGSPRSHKAIELEDGGYLLLQKTTPVYLQNSPRLVEEEKVQALKKLSAREKELLGLK